jgi:hypothetical protein
MGEHDHAVAEPDAGIGDVKSQRLLGYIEIMMNEAGGGWLEKISLHGAVDDSTNLVGT